MEKTAYILHIRGKVQGVFYRKSTRETAERLGLTGWVRNEPDGAVTAEAEGPEEQLQEFIAWCKQGPPAARVQDVEVKASVVKGYSSFEVIR